MNKIDKHYVFVVDTEQYAGNFEREMTAYMTGHVGDCEVGSSESEQFSKDTATEAIADGNLVINKPDDRGCYRPCVLVETPGWFNDGLGGCYRLQDQLQAEEEYLVKARKQWPEKTVFVMGNYPAYLSVGILMSRMPKVAELDLLQQRADAFALSSHKLKSRLNGIVITQFRLLERGSYTEEVATYPAR